MSNLFTQKLGEASNPQELDKLKKKFHLFDPLYVAVSTMVSHLGFREWLEFLWQKYEPYADKNFLSEFKKQFNQRAWELNLGVTLLTRGHTIEEHCDSGPDLRLPYMQKKVSVEAIAIKKGVGEDKVPNLQSGLMDYPEKEMLLRLTAGLVEKYKKYLSYLDNGYIRADEPFVIAIDRSSLDFLDPQVPLILKCLFAIGHQVLLLSRGSRSSNDTSLWSLRDKLSKINGSEVGTFLFGDSKFEGISAVIYCKDDILHGFKDPSQMGDNFVIVHNPFAKNPLPDDFFKFGEVWKQENDQIKKIKT